MSARTVFAVALILGVVLGGVGVALLPSAEPPPPTTIARGDWIDSGGSGSARVEDLKTTTREVDPFDELTQTPPDELRPDQRLPGDPKASPPERIMKPEEWDATPAKFRGSQDEVKGKKTVLGDGTVQINFAYLSSFVFRFEGPQKHQVPERVKALAGKTIQVEGFMIPIQVRQGRVSRFVLVRHILNCCFGQPPKINEVIRVELPKGEEVPRLDGTVIVRGPLRIGVEHDERGEVAGVYRLKATMVSAIR